MEKQSNKFIVPSSKTILFLSNRVVSSFEFEEITSFGAGASSESRIFFFDVVDFIFIIITIIFITNIIIIV
jgi:hypothetical protein